MDIVKKLKEIKKEINEEKNYNTLNLFNLIILANNIKEQINWESISANENILMEIIENNLDLSWNWYGIAHNPNLTINFIKKYEDEFLQYWEIISKNENIQMDDIENNLDLTWTLKGIAQNPNLTLHFIKKHINRFNKFKKIWIDISSNKNMILDIIKSNPNLPWDYIGISKNPNLTINFIKENPNQNWNWEYISANSNITMNDIEENPEYVWDYNFISANPNLTEEFIIKHYEENLNWESISNNQNITFDIIKRHLNWPWDWYFISKHPNITTKMMESNSKLPWVWDGISENPNLTISFIKKYESKVRFDMLSSKLFNNKLNLLKEEYNFLIKRLAKEFYYQTLIKMHNPKTKGYYFRKDMKILFTPVILDLIKKFENKYAINLNLKIKNYLVDEIFEIELKENIFNFEDKEIFNILLNTYGKYGNLLESGERDDFSFMLTTLFFK